MPSYIFVVSLYELGSVRLDPEHCMSWTTIPYRSWHVVVPHVHQLSDEAGHLWHTRSALPTGVSRNNFHFSSLRMLGLTPSGPSVPSPGEYTTLCPCAATPVNSAEEAEPSSLSTQADGQQVNRLSRAARRADCTMATPFGCLNWKQRPQFSSTIWICPSAIGEMVNANFWSILVLHEGTPRASHG